MKIAEIANSAAQHGPSELKRIDYLDGWRGLAILLVLISHFMQFGDIQIGRMGVDVFFVLSGMLMANILFVKKVRLSTFYKRRISRIFPVFVIFLSLISFLSWALSLSDEHNNYFYNLFFIRAYWPIEPHLWASGLPIEHLWSLNVEEHAYVLFSLLTVIPLIKRFPHWVILLLGFGSIVLRYLYVKFPEIASPNWDIKTEIVASFILLSAGYSLIKHHFVRYVPTWLPVVTFVLSFVCYSELKPHYSAQWSIAPFLLAFSVNHLDLTPNFYRQILSFPPLRILGIWSFSIYLWQQPFYIYSGVREQDPFTLAGLGFMTISIIVGAISFYVIENPIRKYLNHRW